MGLTLLTRQALAAQGPRDMHFEWRNLAQVKVKVSTLPPMCLRGGCQQAGGHVHHALVHVMVASMLAAMYICIFT